MKAKATMRSGETLPLSIDEREIDGIFREINQCHLPGAAVGIAVNGRPVYRKGFGLANMELPVVLSPTMRMRIFSSGKHFTCLAFMLLSEGGRADLDAPIGQYLPELHPLARRVTARQLMGHISGLREAQAIRYHFSGLEPEVPSAEVVAQYRDIDDVAAEPGTMFRYNNGGFHILGAIIERLTDQRLEDVLRSEIFEPAGLHNTCLRRLNSDFVPNSATMHMTNGEGGFDRSYIPGAIAGNGGVVTTIDDMLRWLAQMDAPLVGSTATWSAMRTALRLINGTSTGYGLGLRIGQYRGVETLFHAGGGQGGNAQILKVPTAGLDVVVIANRHDVISIDLVNRVLDRCLPARAQREACSSRPMASGVFRSNSTQRVVQLGGTSASLWTKGARQLAMIDGFDLPVEPDGAGVLKPSGTLDFLKLEMHLVGNPEAPSAIHLNEFGNEDELVRVDAGRRDDPQRIAGRYVWEAAGVEARISATTEGPRLHTVGRFGSAVYRLECLARGIWRSRAMNPASSFAGAILAFSESGGEFRFFDYGNCALRFTRVQAAGWPAA